MHVYNEAGVYRFFRVDAADVAANRYGRLGPGQRRGYRSTLLFWSVILVLWLGPMAYAVTIQLDGEAWHGASNLIFTFVFVILVAVGPLLAAWGAWRMLRPTVRVVRFTGQITLGRDFLVVDGRRFRILRPAGNQVRGRLLVPHVDESLRYDVFTVRDRVMSMARA